MKLPTVPGCVVIACLLFFGGAAGFTAEFKADGYAETQLDVLKATPEELKNKKIFFQTVFIKYFTTFPEYMLRSGLKNGKDFCLIVRPETFPVVAEKKDFTETVMKLKFGQTIVVYGKVKKFRHDSKAGLPSYYLECDQIQIPDEQKKTDEKTGTSTEEGKTGAASGTAVTAPPAAAGDEAPERRFFRRGDRKPNPFRERVRGEDGGGNNTLEPVPPEALKPGG